MENKAKGLLLTTGIIMIVMGSILFLLMLLINAKNVEVVYYIVMGIIIGIMIIGGIYFICCSNLIISELVKYKNVLLIFSILLFLFALTIPVTLFLMVSNVVVIIVGTSLIWLTPAIISIIGYCEITKTSKKITY